jgi:hypothetical protein
VEADHKTIDTFLVMLRENPISPSIFSDFLAWRLQNHSRTQAKEYTFNIKGLVNILEENLLHTRDENN